MLPKKSVEEVLQITPCVSDRMADAIQLWSDMYEGASPWCREPTYEDPTRIVSIGLPALIASEKARMATLEMKTEISAPMEEVTSVSDPDDTSASQPINGQNNAVNNPVKPSTRGKPSLDDSRGSIITGGTLTNQDRSPYQIKTKQVPKGPTERADFLNSQYTKLTKQLRRQIEYGIAKGGLVIKPYVVMFNNNKSTEQVNTAQTKNNASGEQKNDFTNKNTATNYKAGSTVNLNSTKLQYNKDLPIAEIEFDFIQADRFFPLSFDANGKVLEAAFVQTKLDKAKERVYIRLEYHKLDRRRVTVQNLAFESTDLTLANSSNVRTATNLGRQISLKDVPEWASLQETTVIEGVDRLLFAYFRMPEANTIDPYSPLGVSGYSRVVQLIRDADMQYSRLLWEFEGGELAIDVDRDALKFVTDPNGEGKSTLTNLQSRLFRKVDLNAEDTYNVFAPPLRDSSIINGLNTILMRIEDAEGLSRGTLSEVNSTEAKTATELKILKQRSFATNADIQQAIQSALEDAIYVMDVYSTLYEITPPGEYEVSFEWDDSIIVDSESELSKRLTLMQNGLASKLETRMWYFGETENQARVALQQVEEESHQAVIRNVQAEMMKSEAMKSQNLDDADENENLQKSSSDTTSAKVSTGKQADTLDNPDKSQLVDRIRDKK